MKVLGIDLVERLGVKRAAVAVARKIGVVLHAMCKTGRLLQAWPSSDGRRGRYRMTQRMQELR